AARREPHAVLRAVANDARPRDRVLARITIVDADEPVAGPADPVSRLRVLDEVAVARPSVDDLPTGAGHVPHPPPTVLDEDPRRRGEIRIDVVAFEDRSRRHAAKRLAVVVADGTADEQEERHRHAEAPPRVAE